MEEKSLYTHGTGKEYHELWIATWDNIRAVASRMSVVLLYSSLSKRPNLKPAITLQHNLRNCP